MVEGRVVKVLKFGGSSVASPEKIRAVAVRISRERALGHALVVVVSAMGDTTDDLIELAQKVSQTPPDREMDMLLTAGERISMSLLSMALADLGVSALSFTGSQSGIITDNRHGRARIQRILGDRIRSALQEQKVAIVAGFQGVSVEREITTLGRGGSDTTAVALAIALHAESCEIFTDVDGVFSADPRKVLGAKLWPMLPGNLLVELASRGAGVLHVRSAELALEHRLKLRVRNTFQPGEGTQMSMDLSGMEEYRIVGVTADQSRVLLWLEGVSPGVLFEISARHGLSSSSPVWIDGDLCLYVDRTSQNTWKHALQDALVGGHLKAFAFEEDVLPVSVVGYRFLQDGAALNEIIEVLAEQKIPVTMGSASALAVTVGVHRAQADQAVKALHQKFLS